MKVFLGIAFALAALVVVIHGHGKMLEPVARNARWRFNSSAPPNWNDNELFCGGLFTQIGNGGKCGICGDNFSAGRPRQHEIGGEYGEGVVVAQYSPGQSIAIQTELSANHKGYYVFHIQNLDNGREEEERFQELSHEQGSGRWNLPSYNSGPFMTRVNLPNWTCNHCVLRWTYIGANNIYTCPDGSQSPECGAQETFKNCADISIR